MEAAHLFSKIQLSGDELVIPKHSSQTLFEQRLSILSTYDVTAIRMKEKLRLLS